MTTTQTQPLAVVTGASSGIGKAYADRFAAEGHALLLVARRQDRLSEVATELSGRHGVPVHTLVADLEQPADLALLEQRLTSERVAVLVNNAGAGALGPTASSTADRLESLIRLNVVALTRLSLAALAGFRERGIGTLINIGSIVAFSPSKGGAAYSGSKAYVLNFTRSLQMEYAGSGLRIQVLMPGPIRTEFFSSQGLSDGIFPDQSYITAEQLVDAAMAGLAAGEPVTSPTLCDTDIWAGLEAQRTRYMAQVMAGAIAPRYLAAVSD